MKIPTIAQIQIDTPYALAILASAAGVIGVLFKLLIASKDREFALILAERDKQIAEMESIKKSYSEIANEAIRSATETTNYYRAKDGKPPLVMMAPVVAEGSSPPSKAQHENASIQTLRAKMAAIRLATGQVARGEPGSPGHTEE